MGWWSEAIMGGDTPLDWEADISDFVGGHFDPDEGHIFTREQLEAKLSEMVAYIEGGNEPDIGLQVLGVLIMRAGADLPDDIKARIVKAAEDDEWAAEDDRKRKAHIRDLIEKVEAYKPGTMVAIPAPSLLTQMEEDLVREQNGPVRVGVSVCIRLDGKTLMGLRKGSHGAGTWSFPGGHQEYGEHPSETAAREVWEETGLKIDLKHMRQLDWTNDHFEDIGQHYITIYYSVDLDGLDYDGKLRVMEPTKCERWEWLEEPPDKLFLPIRNLLKQQPEAFYTP
jgi:8-oxo-dGTP diphosphatase